MPTSAPRRAAVLAAAAALALAVPAASAALKDNPENKRLPPTANAGYFLGYPSHTYSWHGCTASAVKASVRRVPQAPPLASGTRQAAVSFTATLGAPPYVSWQAKRGWTICGVQASVLLSHPDVPALLLAEVGYTSGRQKGSTARDGRETILVPIARKAIDRAEFERYEGKTFTISSVQDVTVFVKRAR